MSTRFVERNLAWCASECRRFLAEHDYVIARTRDENHVIEAVYGRRDHLRELSLSRVRIHFAPCAQDTTELVINFPGQVADLARSVTWFLTSTAPVLVLAFIYATGRRPELLANRAAADLVFVASGAFACWILTRMVLKIHRGEEHRRRLEAALWERMDPDGTPSHETDDSAAERRRDYGLRKLVFLCLAVIGSLWLSTSFLVYLMTPASDSAETRHHSLAFFVALHVRYPAGTIVGLLVLWAAVPGLLISGWLAAAYKLAHRFQWKAKFFGVYTVWWVAISLPALFWLIRFSGAAVDAESSPPRLPSAFRILQTGATWTVLFGQVMCMAATFRLASRITGIAKDHREFDPPSTRYEERGAPRANGSPDRALVSLCRWTLANWAFFSVLCVASAAYLISTVCDATAAVVDSSRYSSQSWRWPILVPLTARSAAIQAIVVACIMGVPFALTWLSAGNAMLRRRTRRVLGRRLAQRPEELGLSIDVVNALQLSLERIPVVIAPLPDTRISVEIDVGGVFRREAVLWVSIGAMRRLKGEELDAVLWHEVYHASQLKRDAFRDLVGLLAPWAFRFLDLPRDLYAQEKEADRFAARRSGSITVLVSALRLASERNRAGLSPEKRAHDTLRPDWWPSFHAFDILFEAGWLAYAYPDVAQRIRWLEQYPMDDNPQVGVEVPSAPK